VDIKLKAIVIGIRIRQKFPEMKIGAGREPEFLGFRF
jgi:hypothetical protein